MSLTVTIDVGGDVCGPYNMSHQGGQRSRSAVSAAHPNFASKRERLQSFDTWPIALPDRQALAAAGFFYTGTFDHCVCYNCGKGLKDWEESDDPWLEHKKHFPDCALTKRKKPSIPRTSLEPVTRNTGDEVQGSSSKQAGRSKQSSSGEEVAVADALLCKICFLKQMCVTFLPCKHVVACEKCALSLKECAVCRTHIKDSLKVYLQ